MAGNACLHRSNDIVFILLFFFFHHNQHFDSTNNNKLVFKLPPNIFTVCSALVEICQK